MTANDDMKLSLYHYRKFGLGFSKWSKRFGSQDKLKTRIWIS